jgi:hypothetical protein
MDKPASRETAAGDNASNPALAKRAIPASTTRASVRCAVAGLARPFRELSSRNSTRPNANGLTGSKYELLYSK